MTQTLANTGPDPVTQMQICVYGGGSDTAPSSVMFRRSIRCTKRSGSWTRHGRIPHQYVYSVNVGLD
ncbi:unnamed protein product [Penicillium camemberti]|uniref:Str. FM013 n=1 Tax=Penicillium camemberti (strain FM 013) TaxID=1429867 RepID=A0A0G4P2Z2_PENC3|nr:unnamed protein product [Penicillium camemberti]